MADSSCKQLTMTLTLPSVKLLSGIQGDSMKDICSLTMLLFQTSCSKMNKISLLAILSVSSRCICSQHHSPLSISRSHCLDLFSFFPAIWYIMLRGDTLMSEIWYEEGFDVVVFIIIPSSLTIPLKSADCGMCTIGFLIPRSFRIPALKQLSGSLQEMLYRQLWVKLFKRPDHLL